MEAAASPELRSDHPQNSDSTALGQEQQEQPQQRRLKRPRVTKACRTCRKRKTSCSGDNPCRRCREEGIFCDYDVVDGRTVRKQNAQHGSRPSTSSTPGRKPHNKMPKQSCVKAKSPETSNEPSRSSAEPGATYDEAQHTGSASGLAFLQEAVSTVQRIEQHDAPQHSRECLVPASTSIFSSGDMPFAPTRREFEMPKKDPSDRLLSRYFDFATPSYRFFHRPTIEAWATELLDSPHTGQSQPSRGLTAAKKAAIFLVWAQALEYHDLKSASEVSSCMYYERARVLIENEPGPPRLESVQARLALCLYLLSTSRVNECWYTFGVTTFIVMALGLHRKRSSSSPATGLVESECQKRVFWSAYVLDRYLSVMKGRPRIFRDEDIDQEYPANVLDSDMVFTDPAMLNMLPTHGLMETTINHARLAAIMGRTTDLLYPLKPPNEAELMMRAEVMLDELNAWEANLPVFLRPSQQTLTGQRIFERQNTVLKLAHAHVRIMITRLFVLENFAALGQSDVFDDNNFVAQRHLNDCLAATYTIIDTVDAFVSSHTLIRGFWFTQYIALCAISTLYIYIIHHHIDPSTLTLGNGKNYFTIAERCQQYLSTMAPEGSPNKRYLTLLAQLRSKARHASTRSGSRNDEQHILADRESSNSQHLQQGGTGLMRSEQTINMEAGMPDQSALMGSQYTNFNFDDEQRTLTSTQFGPAVDFDALPLSWGFLDQLAFPDAHGVFNGQEY